MTTNPSRLQAKLHEPEIYFAFMFFALAVFTVSFGISNIMKGLSTEDIQGYKDIVSDYDIGAGFGFVVFGLFFAGIGYFVWWMIFDDN